MASGKEHLKLWGAATAFLAAPGTAILVGIPFTFQTEPYWEMYHALHFWAGWCSAPILNPDKDIEGQTFEELWISRVFPPLGLAWQLLWYPYAKSIEHRDGKSHGVVIGTLLRAFYLLGVVILSIFAWSSLAHLLLALDGIVDGVPGFPAGAVATPTLWLWPWPLEVSLTLIRWLAKYPFAIMWLLIGQELATIISHLIPDKFGMFRTKVVFGE